MTMNLTNYSSIQTALFVRLDIPDYDVLRFSNFNLPYVIDSETYTPLGQLLNISEASNELRSIPGEMSITISGIPNTIIGEFLDQRIKGSSIQVYRALFNAVSATPLAISGNPAGRFQGIVNNFSIDESFDSASLTASSTILLTCTSSVELLSNKISGRRTNPIDQNQLYPTDRSMDRVLKLSKSNLNWGSPV